MHIHVRHRRHQVIPLLPISICLYGHRAAVNWGPFERGDFIDRNRLDGLIEKYEPDAIIHFAAYAYVGESVNHPGKYYHNNVVGRLILLEAMRDHGIKNIIFSSTCATYGEPETSSISEDHIQLLINPYGLKKSDHRTDVE